MATLTIYIHTYIYRGRCEVSIAGKLTPKHTHTYTRLNAVEVINQSMRRQTQMVQTDRQQQRQSNYLCIINYNNYDILKAIATKIKQIKRNLIESAICVELKRNILI